MREIHVNEPLVSLGGVGDGTPSLLAQVFGGAAVSSRLVKEVNDSKDKCGKSSLVDFRFFGGFSALPHNAITTLCRCNPKENR